MSRSRTTTALTHWFTWRHVRLKVVERRNYLGDRQTLLELHVIAARDTPVPITHTGFRSHFLGADELGAAGGAVPFLRAWMDREASDKAYQRREFLWRQGDLFDALALGEDRDA